MKKEEFGNYISRKKRKMKKYKKVFINGDFLCNNISGIERVALEITKRLDALSKKDEIGIVIAQNAKNIPRFNNLTIIEYTEDLISFPVWQQSILPSILHKQNALCLDFGNACSFFRPGITFLHDIYCELYPDDFITKREKFERTYYRILYRIIAYRAKKIVTVSYFSRDQIIKTFNINPKKIEVIYCGWDHFKDIVPDYNVFNQFPILSKPYYFSLGSLSKRKNLKWIIDYAIKHPEDIFAISGKSLRTVQVNEILDFNMKNIVLLGALDDGKIKALMERCKAFIQPSYYEGFGIPPLEALSCGAQIIVANAGSLPEIYGNTAHYIDPFDTNIELDALLSKPVENPSEILKKYSYDTSALQIYNLIQEFTNE